LNTDEKRIPPKLNTAGSIFSKSGILPTESPSAESAHLANIEIIKIKMQDTVKTTKKDILNTDARLILLISYSIDNFPYLNDTKLMIKSV
jgi:hypothetical protein